MRRSLPVIYLSVNVTCALIVMYAAHRVAAVMAMEQRVESDSVDGVTFFVYSAPGFLIAALANAAWTGKVIFDCGGAATTARFNGSVPPWPFGE